MLGSRGEDGNICKFGSVVWVGVAVVLPRDGLRSCQGLPKRSLEDQSYRFLDILAKIPTDSCRFLDILAKIPTDSCRFSQIFDSRS